MFKSIIVLLFTITCIVSYSLADQIYIHGPPRNAIYHPTDIMDIRYSVRAMGMTKIWATYATLTHLPTNKTIDTFPLVNWANSNGSAPVSIHQEWIIPASIPLGNYSLAINGNTTFVCSKNNNGAAPFDRCHAVLREQTVFVITNGTETSNTN